MSKATHCKRGHERTPENTRLDRGGKTCRACQNERKRAWAEAARRASGIGPKRAAQPKPKKQPGQRMGATKVPSSTPRTGIVKLREVPPVYPLPGWVTEAALAALVRHSASDLAEMLGVAA